MIKKMVFLFLLFFFLPFPTWASSSRVFDNANLFSPEELQTLSEAIEKLQTETQMDYAVVTTYDAQKKTSRSYADDFYESQNLGVGEDYSGMLYLIDLDNQEIYISTEGQMLRYLTDERIESLLDDAFQYAAEGNYADSAYAVLQGAGDYIALGIPKGQYNVSSKTGSGGFLALLIGSLAGLIAALGTFFSIKGKYNLTYETYRYPLHEKSALRLTHSEDRLLHQTLTHRKIPKNPPSSSSPSSRTTTHHSSSGRTHGGGGRRLH